MEIETNEGESYEALRFGGVFYYPRLVLLREVTEAKDWQVADSGTPLGFVGRCKYGKEGYSFSIAYTINDREFYVTEVKPSPEGDNFLLGCYTHYLWSEDKHHMDVKITPYIKNKSTNSCVWGEPKVIGYGDLSAPDTEIESVIQDMTKVVGKKLKFPNSYKEALEQGWEEKPVATNYGFSTDYNSTLEQGSVNTEGVNRK